MASRAHISFPFYMCVGGGQTGYQYVYYPDGVQGVLTQNTVRGMFKKILRGNRSQEQEGLCNLDLRSE